MRRAAAILLTVCLLWGCAGQDAGVTFGDGSLFGDFRGRWWNYYDRGVSRLNEERYEEAAADLREALRGRSRDAWSARTYGLHFTEYFPNRELGVLYYHQGQLNEAEAALQKSLNDVDTARAHHYLDLVKKAQIAQGIITDESAPTITAGLGNVLLTGSREVPLAIHASDDVGVAEVRVNGSRLYQRGSVTEKTFTDTLIFEEGEHAVAVEADDLADRSASESITVQVDVTAPTIAVFEPAPELVTEAGQVKLRGACADNFGITEVRLGEQVIASGGGGQLRLDFEVPLTLTAGANAFPLTVVDAAGNTNSTVVNVYRGDRASREAKLWWLQHRAPERLRVAGTGEMLAAVLASAYTAAESPIDISLIFPETAQPDEVLARNEIPLKVDVLARTQLASLRVNRDEPLIAKEVPVVSDPQGGETEMKYTFDTRISLARGTNDITITAADSAGNSAQERLAIKAEFVITDTPDSKMPLAILAFAEERPEGSVPSENLRLELQQQLLDQGRFDVVERNRLAEVLTEQQLSEALGDRDAALQLGAVIPAQAFLVGNVTAKEGGQEVKVQVVSTETTRVIAIVDTFITEAGSADAIEIGIREIAAQLAEKYPRLTGELLQVSGDTVAASYTAADGVFEGMYILVLQDNGDGIIDDTTGEVILEPTVSIVDRAEITQVTPRAVRGKRLSSEDPVEAGMPTLTW
jgi:hypothetical protein